MNPSLYQVNTRSWLTARSAELGRPATLDDIPDAFLDRLAERRFDWAWFLSVWQTGAASRAVSRSDPTLRRAFEDTLPDLSDADIEGSGFAIDAYRAHEGLGGDEALDRLRVRLAERGIRLMLDFVPNHTALDHPWVTANPEFYVGGTEDDLARDPRNYGRPPGSERVLAHGRDPYFPGWTDTFQLDYANPATQAAMRAELLAVSDRCDGVRCDMAMLLLPDVFERTWGRRPEAFWPAVIGAVRERRPGFTFMAEVYWDLEWTLIQQGFDYAYDKRLYDRLREGRARPVREHLWAGLDYQRHLARFLENHDEPRAAATFPPGEHEAAAAVTFLTPGLRFFEDGQFEGRRVHLSPHLVRAPSEPVDDAIAAFYERLLGVVGRDEVREGQWRLLESRPAWDGNPTADDVIAWSWRLDERELLVAVNYAGHQSQCYVALLPAGSDAAKGRTVRLRDILGTADYERDAADLAARGLYLDVPAWQVHAFEVERGG
jgi:glycosidase